MTSPTIDQIADQHSSYVEMSGAFREQSMMARDRGAGVEAEIFDLMHLVCHLGFRPSDTQPYRPLITYGAFRSVAISDFTAEELARLVELLPSIHNLPLRARIADILWLRGSGSQRFQYAKQCLDAISSIDFSEDAWFSQGESLARRGVSLAKRLGKPTAEFLDKIIQIVASVASSASKESGFYALSAGRVLLDLRVGEGFVPEILPHFDTIIEQSRENNEFQRAINYAQGAAAFVKASDGSQAADASLKIANLWIGYAELRAESAGNSLVAASYYENALKALRAIPTRERGRLHATALIADVVRRLQEAHQDGLADMHAFESGPIDLSESAAWARSTVDKEDVVEALDAFTTLAPFASLKRLREQSEQEIAQFPLQSLFTSIHFTHDGRIRKKSAGAGQPGTPAYEEAVWEGVIKHFDMYAHLMTTGVILPALQTLRAKHWLLEGDFARVACGSYFVPSDRETAFARGLMAGYDGDYLTALYLLAPQIENAVRQTLKSHGVQTTRLSEDVEDEVGLTVLLATDDFDRIIGEDVAFEMRALMTDRLGPNLRNEVAHGLLPDGAAFTAAAVYFWWFVLRLVFRPYMTALQDMDASTGPSSP